MDSKELRRIVQMLRLGNDITEYAESKLLIIADNAESKQLIQSCVVGRSEQLKCGNPNPPCSPNIKFGMLECCNCEWGE